MITATGNNFGAGEIIINDFQSDNLIVLNGVIDFDPKNGAFQDASVLEIYLPELTVHKSGMGACYIMATIGEEYYGTTLKTWIQNKNTLCIEKLDCWDEIASSCRIYLLTMYSPKGKRIKQFQVGTLSEVYPTFENTQNKFSLNICYVDDNWCLFGFGFDAYDRPKNDLLEVINLEGFPTDVEVELPFVTDKVNLSDGYGVLMMNAHLKDAVLTIDKLLFGWGGNPVEYFFYAACVRNKTNITE